MKLHWPCGPVEVIGPVGLGGVGGFGAVICRREHLARIPIRLVNAERAGPCIPGIRKHIAHVVKEHKTQRVAEEGQHRRRQPQFRAVHQRARAANRKPRLRVARTRCVDGESAMRRGTAGIEPLGQRNQTGRGRSICAFLAITRVARQHKTALVESVIARIGKIEPVELRLRAEALIGKKVLKARVGSAVRIERRVARVANPGDARTRHAHGRRQRRNLARPHLQALRRHLHAPEVEFINKRIRLGKPGTGLR